jgi:hypothetical protein
MVSGRGIIMDTPMAMVMVLVMVIAIAIAVVTVEPDTTVEAHSPLLSSAATSLS